MKRLVCFLSLEGDILHKFIKRGGHDNSGNCRRLQETPLHECDSLVLFAGVECVVDDVCYFGDPFALDIDFFVMSFDGIQARRI